MKIRRYRGPLCLFLAWVLHDIEEAATFPDTCDYLADRTGIEGLRMSMRQSWAAVGLMGILISFACARGASTGGGSRLYRAVTAGLEAHVFTHLGASALTHRYTAGAISAVPVMLPGAVAARRQLAMNGRHLKGKDYARGAAVLVPAALACHIAVRMVPALFTKRAAELTT